MLCFFCVLMIRRPPRPSPPDTLLPYTTLFRSQNAIVVMQHQQPRRLGVVEGGLQVDLGSCAGLPEAVHHQLTGGAGAGGEEGQAVAARGHRKILDRKSTRLNSSH